ncbi:MAG: CaiB/BaiF CoA transferase family protein [Humibacter sp.]
MSEERTRPLDGVRILELSRALAGPLCATLLSDLGAEVIKVEPLDGDPSRAWGPHDGDESLYFASVNHGKRTIALDFRDEAARKILLDLVRASDVLIESFRPGVLGAMGLDPVTLQEANPRLIVASVTGFGSVGPLRHAAGLDQIAQAMSGLMSVTGASVEETYRVGVPIVDFMTGLVSVIGVLSALLARGESGVRVETSLLETALYSLVFQAQAALLTGENPAPQGNMHPTIQPYGAYRAADGEIVLAASSQRHWAWLCEILGAEELLGVPEFGTPTARVAYREALTAEIEARLAGATVAEWVDRLTDAGIPAGPVLGVSDALAQQQVAALDLVQSVSSPHSAEGRRLLAAPLRFDDARLPIAAHPPRLGESSREILIELGWSQSEVDALVERGAVVARS